MLSALFYVFFLNQSKSLIKENTFFIFKRYNFFLKFKSKQRHYLERRPPIRQGEPKSSTS